MSAPAGEGSAVPVEKSKRLSTLVSRMKTVLKRTASSKRLSFSSKPAPAPTAPLVEASTVDTEEPPTAPIQEEPTLPTAPTAPEPPKETTKIVPQPRKVSRAEIDAERARKLGERFKVTLEPVHWPSEKEAFRVEKPIRMRIHRQCHRCNTTFGGSKSCSSCQHNRCTKCPRYPAKKTGEKKVNEGPTAAFGMIEPDDYWGLRDIIDIRMPNPRPGGQPLVRKKPMQRVRRTCHECSTLFLANAKICTGCSHIRCTDCPRDPAKKKRYPDGYPGDAPSSNTSLPVKYACHQCSKTFPPIPHPDSGQEQPRLDCERCGHERCAECPRAKPRKVEPEPDPELLRRVEAKLAALRVGTTPS